MKISKLKVVQIFIVTAVFLLVLAYINYDYYLINPVEVKADSTSNVSGWAWNDAIGWISLNSLNCDSDENGFVDSGNCGGDNSTIPIANYGVNIDLATGAITGYAWSETVGYIRFDPAGVLPGNPNSAAQMDIATGNISGWIKICSEAEFPAFCSDSFSNPNGWIKMRCFETECAIVDYGVNMNASNELIGFAYSDDYGFISFSSLNCDPDNDGLSEGGLNGCPPADTNIEPYSAIVANLSSAAEHNVYGWAWSSNFGWVSFNKTELKAICDISPANDIVDNPIPDPICPPAGTYLFNYGVDIDTTTNNDFSGFAWSSNLGWIYFGPDADLGAPYGTIQISSAPIAPDNPKNWGKLDGATRKVSGWANILALGSDGWISLADNNIGDAFDYGLSIGTDGIFSGWAWNNNDNGQSVGWLSFNCNNPGAGGCSGKDYKVWAILNTPPTIDGFSSPNLSVFEACQLGVRRAYLDWVFHDADIGPPPDAQAAYQIIIDDDNDPDAPLLDTGHCTAIGVPTSNCVIAADAAHFPAHETSLSLNFNIIYYWWVIVWDNNGASSGISPAQNFTVPFHEWPEVDFEWAPANISAGEAVLFDSIGSAPPPPPAGTVFSKYYATGNPATALDCDDPNCSYEWSISLGTGIFDPSNNTATTTITFDTPGAKKVKLKVTDSAGYWCEAEKDVAARKKLPSWIETK